MLEEYYSPEKIANKANISKSTIYSILNNDQKYVNPSTLRRIKKAFGYIEIEDSPVNSIVYKHNKKIVESIPNPFYIINVKDCTIHYANSAAKKLKESRTATCYALFYDYNKPCQDRDGQPCPLNIIRKTRKPTVVEHVHFDLEGNRHWYEIHAFPIFNGSGNLTQIIEHLFDITKRKLQSKQLRESNNIKELLLDIITHDLINPAGTISGMTDILAQENPDDELIRLIKESSDNLLEIVENANTLSMIVGLEEIEMVDLDLCKVIEKVVREYQVALKSAEIEVEFQAMKKLQVKANPIIEEVFRNYIDNATKYAAQGKRIVIEAVENDGHVIVGVQDFGRAILEKDYPRIWNRSISLEICAKRGRGLGLAIVKHIADAHDAKVWVEPNEPKGNIFYLKIPRERIS